MRELVTFENLLNHDLVFVFFDLETTGLSPILDRIVEIGAIKYQDGRIIDQFSCLVDPEVEISLEASAVNGITQDMVRGQGFLQDVLPQFLRFIHGSILVAHNASFDISFIQSSLSRLNLDPLTHDFIDTKIMAQKALPGRKSYSLQNLASDLGVRILEAHRAVDDSRICQEVFVQCLKRFNPANQASFF